MPFQDNPKTGDCRICGTTASLAGVEAGDPGGIERVLLLYSIALSSAGIPLIYLGDEVGQLNDYAYLTNEHERGDSRWVHRPHYPQARYTARHGAIEDAGRIFGGLKHLIALRQATAEFAGNAILGFETHNPHVLGYRRPGASEGAGVLVLANFADAPQTIHASTFAALPARLHDLVGGESHTLRTDLMLRPRQFVWLKG